MKKFGFIKKVTAAATAAAMVASLGISAFALEGNAGNGITIDSVNISAPTNGIYTVTVGFTANSTNNIGMTMLTYASNTADDLTFVSGDTSTWPSNQYKNDDTMKVIGVDQIAGVSDGNTGTFTFNVSSNTATDSIYLEKGKTAFIALSGDGVTTPAVAPITLMDYAESADALSDVEATVSADKKNNTEAIDNAILDVVKTKSVKVKDSTGTQVGDTVSLSTVALKADTHFTKGTDGKYTGIVVIPEGTKTVDGAAVVKAGGIEVAVTATVSLDPVAATQITKVGGNAAVDNKFAIELGEDELATKDIAGVKDAVAARTLKATVADETGNVTYDVPITAGMLGTEAAYGSAMDFTLTVGSAALADSAELTLASDATVTATISVNVTEKTYIKSIALSGDAINVTVTKGADDDATKAAIVSALNTAIAGRTFTVDTTSGITFDKVEYEWVVTGSDKAFTATMKVTKVTAEDVNELPAGGLAITAPAITITVNEAPAFKYGDLNGDGGINYKDYGLAKQRALGKISEFRDAKGNIIPEKAMDVNDDDNYNYKDYGLIKQRALGKIAEFPVESK